MAARALLLALALSLVIAEPATPKNHPQHIERLHERLAVATNRPGAGAKTDGKDPAVEVDPNGDLHQGLKSTVKQLSSILREREQQLGISLAFLAAGFVHSIAGFGSGMVSMAIIPLFLPMRDAVPLVGLFCCFLNITIAIQLRRGLQNSEARAVLYPLVAGQLLGTPLGIVMLRSVNGHWLRLLLGMAMLSTASGSGHGEPGEELSTQELKSHKERPRGTGPGYGRLPVAGNAGLEWTLAMLAGVASGILNGALNEGAPPTVIYLTHRGWDKDRFKAVLNGFFASMSLYAVPLFVATHLLKMQHVSLFFVGAPAAVVGIVGGTAVYSRLDAKTFSRMLNVSLLLLGTLYCLKSARALFLGEEEGFTPSLHPKAHKDYHHHRVWDGHAWISAPDSDMMNSTRRFY